jgi:hypothetical protein
MHLHTLTANLTRPQSLTWVSLKQVFEEIFHGRAHILRQLEWGAEDLSMHYFLVFVPKWWKATQHFIDEGAESPPVNLLSVTFAQKELRGQVLWAATKRKSATIESDSLFTQPKIDEANVAIHIEQNVLGLEVTVDDLSSMKVRQRRDNLSGVKTGSFLGKVVLLSKMVE